MSSIQDMINEWNPLDIYPLLQDEYSYEVEKIEQGLSDQMSICSLADLIHRVFQDSFGEQYRKSEKECRKIAREILKKQKEVL